MELTEINCPRCNALQLFKPKFLRQEDGNYEKFIICGKCRWRRVLATLNPQEMRNHRRESVKRKRSGI
jgi:hypothetical protein